MNRPLGDIGQSIGSTSRGTRLSLAIAVVIILLVGVLLLLGTNEEAVRHRLAHWTGEDDLREQIKGTGALVLLRLGQFSPRTEPYLPMIHSSLPPYGINTFLEQEAEPEKVELSLRFISDAGFTWIRQQFPWEDIEISGKGDFWDHRWNKSAWAKYDYIVETAERYGLRVIARLDNPPAWSRRAGNAKGWEIAPPDDFEDYGDFVYAVVSRYKGRIKYYQIWNEPNIYPEWGDQPADPAGYVRLLQIAYRRAKQADPDCVIIAAGLAQTTEETPAEFGPRNMSDLLYLEKMYQAGVKGSFDIMGAMVYGLWTGPYDLRVSRDRSNFSRVQLLREIMVRYGDGHKPIWATEVGWNALPEDFPGFANFGRVSEEKQAVYAVEAYRRAAREWPWMGVMNYWFFRRPSDAEKGQTWYYFRMLEPDFTPLPVYSAMRWLTHQPPTMPIGYHQEDHWTLNYEGSWQRVRDERAILGSYALGARGAVLGFFFEGTELNLALRLLDEHPQVSIMLDNRPVHVAIPDKIIPADTVVVPLLHSLPDMRHRILISVDEGQLALDGILVKRASPWQRWNSGIAIIAILGTLGLACYGTRRQPRSGDAG